MSLLSELNRRNVFKVGGAYTVAAWLLLQIVDLVLENINAPDWVMQVFMLAMAVGLPIVLIAAWALELTPDGIKLEKNVDQSKSIARQTGRQLNRGIIMILSMVIVLLLTDKYREETDVASRTSAFSLADEDLDIPAIATRLGVAHILEGSIRTSGQQVRVTAQLIDVDRDVHLWSETYNGSLDDIFKIQDEITLKITDAMKVQLGSGTLAPSSELLTDNAEAYQLYLQGRHLWRQRNSIALHEAVRLFKQAVALDPGFHQAWSNLAVAYLVLPDYDHTFGAAVSFELGLKAAQRALEIWPQSTEALIITASYNEVNCDFSKAADLYEKAIAFNPLDPTAHHWYAILLGSVGRITLALEHIQEARRIDPLISAVVSTEAELNMSLGRYTRAEELHRTAAILGLNQGSLLPVAYNHLFAGIAQEAWVIIEDELDGPNAPDAKRGHSLLEALESPDQEKAFEASIGKADESKTYENWWNLIDLAILGSPYAFEFQAHLECPMVNNYLWAESFRKQRGTPEFFNLMERAGVVEYWRKFGWPDDCESMDQTLAECK